MMIAASVFFALNLTLCAGCCLSAPVNPFDSSC